MPFSAARTASKYESSLPRSTALARRSSIFRCEFRPSRMLRPSPRSRFCRSTSSAFPARNIRAKRLAGLVSEGTMTPRLVKDWLCVPLALLCTVVSVPSTSEGKRVV